MTDAVRPLPSGISHLALSVSDLDRSIDFYCDVLGAALIRPPYAGDSESFSGRMALVMLGSLSVDLLQHAANDAQGFDPAHTGLDHLALRAGTYDELEEWAGWLDEHQVARSPIRDSGDVGAMFDFTDPDGVQLEFFFLDRDKLQASEVYSAVSDGNA
jgi:glyoxylase I family protein